MLEACIGLEATSSGLAFPGPLNLLRNSRAVFGPREEEPRLTGRGRGGIFHNPAGGWFVESPLFVCRRGPGLFDARPRFASSDRPRNLPAGVVTPQPPRSETAVPVSTRTPLPKISDNSRRWIVVDADGKVLGRLATLVARAPHGQDEGPSTRRSSTPATSSSSSTPRRSPSRATKLGQKLYRHHTGYPRRPQGDRRPASCAAPPRAGHRGGRARHAAEDEARPEDVQEAEGLRRSAPPALRAGSGTPSRSDSQEVQETRPLDEPPVPGRRTPQRVGGPRVPSPRQGDRSRSTTGTFEDFFPNDVLKMVIRQPLQLTETVDKFDVVALVEGGGSAGQAGAIRHGIARALCLFNRELRGDAQEGRPPHARLAHEGAKEVRTARRPRPVPVLEEVTGDR